jgi:hypothetical protein
MPIEEIEATGAQLVQQERCKNFAALTAERIRAARNCQFSLLPREELARLVANWYESYALAMMRGNFAAIDQWIRFQSERAASEGFAREDVVELLRLCRSSAIETEKWDPDIVAEVDEVVDEALGGTNKWTSAKQREPVEEAQADSEESVPRPTKNGRAVERRSFDRNRLQLPIRVRGVGKQSHLEEVTHTQSISRGGLYFVTRETYQANQILKISYPFWTDPGAINCEYPAKVMRVDRISDHAWGVGIQFLDGDADRVR